MTLGVARRFSHDGRTLLAHTLERSTGPHFVLVHGIGVATRYYRRLARVLARTGTVHTLVLPGHGSAPTPALAMSIDDYAEHVGAYLVSRGLDSPIVVGHSMGAQVVTALAVAQPERVRRIALIGAVVDPAAPTALGQMLRLMGDMTRETPTANWAVLADYLRTGPRWYFATVPTMLDYDMIGTLPSVSADTLVIRGARDPISGHEWGVQVTGLLPSAALIEVAGQAHVVQHTATDEVAAHIVSLAQHGLGERRDDEAAASR